MTTTVVSTIGASGRDFATVALWIASLPNLTTSDTIQVGRIFNDNGFGSPATADSNPTISAAGATATNYLVLEAADGEEFLPNNKNGAWIQATGRVANITAPFTRVRHVGFVSTNSGASAFNVLRIGAANCWLHACYVEMEGGSSSTNNGFADLSTGTVYTGCIAKGARGAGLSIGFGAALGGQVLLNCVARRIERVAGAQGVGFVIGTAGITTGTVHNCISVNSGLQDFSISAGSAFSHCISTDSSATGTGSLNGFDDEHLFQSVTSFRPIFNSAGFNAGMDPSSLWPVAAVNDFEELPHNGDGNGWEIGPYNLDNPSISSPAVGLGVAPTVGTILVAGVSAPAVGLGVAPPVATLLVAGLSSPSVGIGAAPSVALVLIAGLAAPAVGVGAAPAVSIGALAVLLSPAVGVGAAPPVATLLVAGLAPAVGIGTAPSVALELIAGLASPAVGVGVAPSVTTPGALPLHPPGLVLPCVVLLEIELEPLFSRHLTLPATVTLEVELAVASGPSVTLPVTWKPEQELLLQTVRG